MLRNSDDLFSKPAFSASLIPERINEFYTNLFVFQPNLQVFETLLESGENLKGKALYKLPLIST